MGDSLGDQELNEIKRLLAGADEALSPHMGSELGAHRYINNADKIKRILAKGRLLDWGCGLGQMSYLLKKRGLEVVSYDVGACGRRFLELAGQPLILATDAVRLPFPDASFDAVLSSGVLEHVPDESGSLREISRIIRPGGYFFIFMLPNKYSYIEFLSDRLGRGDHQVKYSLPEIRTKLARFGFEVLSGWYQGFFPYNFKSFPEPVRKLYHRLDSLTEKLDPIFSALPLIKRLSTNLELVARKAG